MDVGSGVESGKVGGYGGGRAAADFGDGEGVGERGMDGGVVH